MKPSVKGIAKALPYGDGGGTFDQDGLGENIATLGRAREEEDQFYRQQQEDDLHSGMGGVLSSAVHMGQQGGSYMQPAAMKVFLQALHEKNATIGKKSGLDLPDSPAGQPMTYDPTYQESAVDPNNVRMHRAAVDMRTNPQYYDGQNPSLQAIRKIVKGQ
jgi:hypothetical protein